LALGKFEEIEGAFESFQSRYPLPPDRITGNGAPMPFTLALDARQVERKTAEAYQRVYTHVRICMRAMLNLPEDPYRALKVRASQVAIFVGFSSAAHSGPMSM